TPEQVHELKHFGGLFVAELQKVGTGPEDLKTLPAKLKTSLPPDAPWLRHVECRTGQGIEQALKHIAQQRPYVLLTPDDFDRLQKMFEPAALDAAMERVAATLEDLPPNSPDAVLLKADPLGIAELGRSELRKRMAQRK